MCIDVDENDFSQNPLAIINSRQDSKMPILGLNSEKKKHEDVIKRIHTQFPFCALTNLRRFKSHFETVICHIISVNFTEIYMNASI